MFAEIASSVQQFIATSHITVVHVLRKTMYEVSDSFRVLTEAILVSLTGVKTSEIRMAAAGLLAGLGDVVDCLCPKKFS